MAFDISLEERNGNLESVHKRWPKCAGHHSVQVCLCSSLLKVCLLDSAPEQPCYEKLFKSHR